MNSFAVSQLGFPFVGEVPEIQCLSPSINSCPRIHRDICLKKNYLNVELIIKITNNLLICVLTCELLVLDVCVFILEGYEFL